MPDTSSDRQILSYSNPFIEDDIYEVAELDIDNVGNSTDVPGGPETMSVYTFPFYDNTKIPEYTPSEADRSGLDITKTYAWVGAMEYYLDAWAVTNTNEINPATDDTDALLSSATIDGVAANPVVYIFDGDGNQKGYFTLPAYQDIETASVLRINMYYDNTDGEWFQFLPQVQAYRDFDSIRSLEDEGSSAFAIQGKKRN